LNINAHRRVFQTKNPANTKGAGDIPKSTGIKKKKKGFYFIWFVSPRLSPDVEK
jgi:hypothetical protein